MHQKYSAMIRKKLSPLKKVSYCLEIFLFFLLIFPAAISAQEALSLDRVWDLALHNNLSLQQQDQSIDQAQMEIWIQRTGMLPALSLNSFYQYQSELARAELPFPGLPAIQAGTYNQYSIYAVVQQPLFRGFRTLNSIAAASKKHELQLAQSRSQRNSLLLQSAHLFYDLQLNFLQQEVLQQSIKRNALQLEKLENLLLAEQISSFDTLEIANHKLDLLNRLQLIRDQNNILKSKLEYLLNVPSLPGIDRSIPAETSFTLKPLDEYQALALEKRPEVAQISLTQQIQQNTTGILKAGYYPQINAQAAYHHARPGVNFFKDEWMDYYILNLTLQWELWNWRRDADKVQQARLEQQKLELENQKLVNDIKQQVKEVYLYLQSLIQQIQLQKRLIDQENERYRITQEKFQQGLMTSLDLNTAEHALTEAQLRLQENNISWQKYKIQLEFVCGTIGTTE
jgi:outer membrane protein